MSKIEIIDPKNRLNLQKQDKNIKLFFFSFLTSKSETVFQNSIYSSSHHQFNAQIISTCHPYYILPIKNRGYKCYKSHSICEKFYNINIGKACNVMHLVEFTSRCSFRHKQETLIWENRDFLVEWENGIELGSNIEIWGFLLAIHYL